MTGERRVYEDIDAEWISGEVTAEEYFEYIRAQVRTALMPL